MSCQRFKSIQVLVKYCDVLPNWFPLTSLKKKKKLEINVFLNWKCLGTAFRFVTQHCSSHLVFWDHCCFCQLNTCLFFYCSFRRVGERSLLSPGVQTAQCFHHPSDAQLLRSLQLLQLDGSAQTPPTDAHLQHQDGGRQVWFWSDETFHRNQFRL